MKGYIDMVLNDDDYDLALAGWTSPAADPDFMLTPVLGSSSFRGEVEINLARFSNDLFNESLLAARRLPLSDVWGRVKLYNEAIGIFNEQLPFIPLFHTRLFLVCNKRVKGVKPTPSGLVSFTRVWLKD
jgi:ABC-type transport system substrate-binding protein